MALEATPGELISTCYYYLVANIVAKAAHVLANDADATTHTKLAADIAAAVNAKYNGGS